MRIKRSYTEEQIALMPAETRINVQTEINANPDIRIKRKARIKAIKKKRTFNLDENKMQARLQLANKAIDARKSKNILTETQSINSGIYCCKTGAFIGRIDTTAITMANELQMPFDEINELDAISSALPTWQTHHAIHPAWLNTSASVLAQLQRIMPHEYIIYVYTYLIERHSDKCQAVIKTMAEIEENKWVKTSTTCITTIPAPYKHHLLKQLYLAPLAEVVEIAELLRILAALMGKSKAIIIAMPMMQIREFLFVGKYRNELLAFLRTALEKQQKKWHSRDIRREALTTSACLYELTSAYGMRVFATAKIKPDDDNPVIGDVAELFYNAGISSVTVAREYSKVKAKTPEKKKQIEYTHKLIISEPESAKSNGTVKLSSITL